MTQGRSPQISQREGVTIIALGSEYESLDESHLEELSKLVLEIASTAEPPRVVIDLSHTKFFGSAFIEVLFRAWNRLSTRDQGRFGISGLTTYCKEVIDVTHLDRLWDVFETCDEAVQTLAANGEGE